MAVLVEPHGVGSKAFHVWLPREHVDGIEEEGPRRLFRENCIRFGVEGQALLPIGFGTGAIEDR